MKRIFLLGATGRTGGFALDYALAKGLEVAALARRAHRLPVRPGLLPFAGSPAKHEDVERAIDGCDAVVSMLNNNRSSDWPWAKQVSPPDFMACSIANTVAAMKARGIRRIVVLSVAGAGDSAAFVPRPWRWLVEHSNLKLAYADHEAQERVLAQSGLDWTAVRAVAFAGHKLNRTILSYDGQPKPRLAVSRKQVATFMIDCLGHPEFFAKAPVAS